MSGDLIKRGCIYEKLLVENGKRIPSHDGFNKPMVVSVGSIRKAVIEAPVAYDVEKVIRQLEELTIKELGIDRERFGMDREEYSSYCSLCLADVLEIVKHGGID